MEKVYYYETNILDKWGVNIWGLTTNFEEAKRLGVKYRLASYLDLVDSIRFGFELFRDCFVEIEDGVAQFSNITNEYIMLWDRAALEHDEKYANASWAEELAAAYEAAGF
ncbi:hypothetical protein [Clostridium sp. DJ247]|uniref:hypothetical protein n=1 Tax=Clostridium sp. DJ247 TaxID=2726188 RepID=UPI00162AD27B|nr:hypothetical protein [Clostridium sp. DJ247]MBC2580827.1 hypothetical protein [Clostridium sp. DJ247]